MADPTLHTVATPAQVEECLERGDDINKYVYAQGTPLVSAIKRLNLEMIDCLLDKGAHPDISSGVEVRPIHQATIEDRVDIMERLIKAGASVDSSCHQGTSLSIASSKGFTDAVDFLISKGANLFLGDSFNDTPLEVATEAGHVDVVDRLLAAGAGEGEKASHALCLACLQNKPGIIDRLVVHGANVNFRGARGMTPLIMASYYQSTKAVERLIGLGAFLDIQDDNGTTALMKATSYYAEEIVRMLLEAGADTEITNAIGSKASDIRSTPKIALLFKEYYQKKGIVMKERSQEDILEKLRSLTEQLGRK